ncbi:ribosome assembly cofactor RimP [Brachyspira pilosicoli]|uniref:ribosome assembly cofactor RimP n=1 Tax=Brachyspira pilosicoli TaxID=52584 RepID=UPI001CA5114E|nr:ribosome assembly cofactor RimP [Brachyspira pilosicoli]MBW5383705.1 ribosome assembly cofactor RimP [Brachyspira pilosicoli]
MSEKNNRRPQRQKEYGRDAKKKKVKPVKKDEVKVIDQELLFENAKKLIEKHNIYLLDLKVLAVKDNKKVYAVIFKKKESVSHNHCIEATRVIQEVIKNNGYDEGDYTITVSSAGFRWKFDDNYELFEDMPIKIKYKVDDDNYITTTTILKEAKDDYIIIKNDDDNIDIKILKSNIIKTRLNC